MREFFSMALCPALAKPYLIFLLIMSVVAFVMMGVDKNKARLHKRRISEKALFTAAALGGAAGGWLGIYVFRHKTRHWYFVLGFPLLAAAQFALFLLLS